MSAVSPLEDTGRHLLLVDLSSIYWQTWHAQGPADDATAPHDGTVRRVRELAARHGHLAVCCDSPRNWRRERFAEYKANREAKPPAAIAQLRSAIDTLTLDGFVVWEVDGLEADDVIASAVRLAAPDVSVTIATADKDLSQLVGPRVRILSTRDGSYLGLDEVLARYGVGPELLGDWLALVGDTSDNIPGVPGVGAKSATALLQAFSSLQGVIDAARDEASPLKPKQREAILQHQAQLGLARVLVELRSDAGLDVEAAMRPRELRPLRSASDREMGAAASFEEEESNVENDTTTQEQETLAPEVAMVVQPPQAQPEEAPRLAEVVAFAAPQQHAIVQARAGSDDWALALEPQSPEAAWKLAGAFANSRLFGGFQNREALFAAIMLGRTLGVPAATIVRSVHVIEGKLSLSAQFIVGLVMKSGKADFFKCVERSDRKAVWKTHRNGDPDPQPVMVTWSYEDADRAGLTRKGGNWAKYPAQMLSHRASSDLARMVYPDVVGGLYTPDELEEVA